MEVVSKKKIECDLCKKRSIIRIIHNENFPVVSDITYGICKECNEL